MLRTHTCGELNAKHAGKSAVLAGWVDSIRSHGGITFISLRDRYGITQITFNKDFPELKDITKESVISVSGKVQKRPKELVRKELSTGEIELIADSIKVFSISEPVPLDMSGQVESTEDTKLKYRYLDLRDHSNLDKFIIRSKASMAAREFFEKEGFIEIQTPMLVKSTPEGARDYVVPSRVNKGSFYALPQSPQLYKQICMIAGFDKYFQMPICLRDEDLRQDRQPEHTQIDLELSFVELEDLYALYERFFKHLFKKVLDKEVKIPFPRFTYQESMDKYGIDKPDIRFELFLHDISDIVKDSGFKVFADTIKNGGIVKCINPDKEYSRKEIDRLTEEVKVYKAKGLAYAFVKDKKLDGGISKFLDEKIQSAIIKKLGAKDNSTIFFVADSPSVTNASLSHLRNKFGKELKLYKEDTFQFCYITDFPLFEWDEEEKKWIPCHHMFCMPKEEHIPLIDSDPGKVLCTQYDLVLNGVELGSGSLRINNPELQKKVMNVVGISGDEAKEKFGFLLEAYRYGGPPHGGIGLGFDRIVALMCGTLDIREVIAFPKNKKAQCPMDDSPSLISRQQMDELNIRVTD